MLDLPLPGSKPIGSLSPTAFDALRLCPLRVAFGQHQAGARPPRTPHQVLGDLCHAVLEALVDTGSITRSNWEQEIDALWLELAGRMVEEVRAHPHEPSLSEAPQAWPGYVIKRARLKKAAGRLHRLLASAGPDAELISEQPMSSSDGRLRGRPDLIVRAAQQSWVVDFKSGAVIGQDQAPRASYVRQLHFYALLEEATSGRWPSQGFLVPLNGPIVEVPIDPATATQLGVQVYEAADRFNYLAPGPQPAAPSPEACGYCPWSTRCPAFWQACDTSWEGPLAAAGVVLSASHAQIGGVSLTLHVERGSLGAGERTVRNIPPREHPAAVEAKPGDQVACVGLRPLKHDGELALPAWGKLQIWSAPP